MIVIISVVISIIVLIISIPLGIFLFKAPKERGRVLQGTDGQDDDEDNQIEPMAALPDAPMGNTF